MRWVTFIWAVVIGACATIALPHLLIGIKRKTWENLFFAIAALTPESRSLMRENGACCLEPMQSDSAVLSTLSNVSRALDDD